MGEVPRQFVVIDVDAVLLLVAGSGDVVEFDFPDIPGYIVRQCHRPRHVPHQRLDVDLRAALDDVPLVQHQFHVVQALIHNLVSLALQLFPEHHRGFRHHLVGLDHAATHHNRTFAGEIDLREWLGVGQYELGAEGVEHHLITIDAHEVLMHPDDLIVANGGITRVLAVLPVLLAGLRGRVVVVLHGRPNLPVGQLLPLRRLGLLVDVVHHRLDVADVHRNQANNVGAGLNRVDPRGARVDSNVLDRHQFDARLILLDLQPGFLDQHRLAILAKVRHPELVGSGLVLHHRLGLVLPILVRAGNPDRHAVLHRPNKGQEPGDGLGQPVVDDLFPKVGAGGLVAVVLIYCGGGDYIEIAEEGCGGRGFVLADQ